MNSSKALHAKYPSANLVVYDAFIELCRQHEPEPKVGETHEHHICPRKQFPELEQEPSNLVTLYTVLHTHAHRLLAHAVPEIRFVTPPAWIAAAANGGRIGGRLSQSTQKKNGTGLYSREVKVKGGRIGGVISTHKRWHVNRSIVNPLCELCAGVSQ
jgi:hypothetical protein